MPKITCITGTRKGIGQALAQHYLEKGHIVIGCSRAPLDWKFQTPENYYHYQLDVADERAVRNVAGDLRRRYGRIDHLINNAGIAAMNHSLLMPGKTAQNILQTNVLGVFLFCREAAKLMQKQRYGRIVNFSTVAVPLKLDGEALYAASKAAVVTLTQILAREYASYGITVNAVGPTPVKTDLIRVVPKEKIDRLLQRQAIHRYGTFEDITNVIDFYLQETSHFITGQTLYLGGI